jgi:predicted phosphodiesterase
LGVQILGPRIQYERAEPKSYPHRANLDVPNGIVIVASDAHYWPGPASLMHKALVSAIKEHKPKIVIMNGDVVDAPTISRHARIGWEERPALADEIENAKERMHEVAKVAGRAEKIWCLGNHDSRYETRLANVAPEYARIHGTSLQDHFPLWRPAWSCWLNDSVVVKHRWKGGIHAPYNNTVYAGKTMVTGHLHSARVTPFTDYNGTRYGVDTGCIAETDHKAFVDYTEDSPKNWRSAFGVFTFKDGQILYPELVTKWDDERVQFRGWVGKP